MMRVRDFPALYLRVHRELVAEDQVLHLDLVAVFIEPRVRRGRRRRRRE
jgi:hypothetical protein